MEKDSLKEATCELIREARLANSYLRELIDLKAQEKAGRDYQRFTQDEPAFLDYWRAIPFRDDKGSLSNEVIARRAWNAGLECGPEI